MVRKVTSLWRCQSNCRRSRSAGVGTQILGKRFESRRSRMSRASRSSVFCLRTSLARIMAEFREQAHKPVDRAGGFDPYANRLLQAMVKLRRLAVLVI